MEKKNIYLIFLFFFALIIIFRKKIEKFRTRVLFIDNKTKKVKKEMVYYQHNKLIVNHDNFKYTEEYKKQLLYNVNRLLKSLQIRFVIAHGNLIEFVRNQTIHHDDDIDIRIYSEDFYKWEKYCKTLDSLIDKTYNLKFDSRILDIEKQKFNGLQISLNKFVNNSNIKEYDMEIHCDLVINTINDSPWIAYDIDFNKLRHINYNGIDTYAPSFEDTDMILRKEYGKDYIHPNFKPYSME